MTIRVVLADDHPLILSGLEDLLSKEGDFDVVASCKNGEECLDTIRKHQPDILVLDIRMPRKDGLTVLQELRGMEVPTKVVIFTGEMEKDAAFEAMKLGVKGIILKEMAPRFLPQCLRKVYAGGEWIERQSFSYAVDYMLHHEEGIKEVQQMLTKREIDIVLLAAKGMRNSDIAGNLCISEPTVKRHLYNIFTKLGIDNRSSLVRYAHDKRLL